MDLYRLCKIDSHFISANASAFGRSSLKGKGGMQSSDGLEFVDDDNHYNSESARRVLGYTQLFDGGNITLRDSSAALIGAYSTVNT